MSSWLTTPALMKMARLATPMPQRAVIVHWSDGDEALVELDSELYADEMDDGIEGWIVDVVKVTSRAPNSTRRLPEGHPTEIRADDPPDVVMSPDRSKVWRQST